MTSLSLSAGMTVGSTGHSDKDSVVTKLTNIYPFM